MGSVCYSAVMNSAIMGTIVLNRKAMHSDYWLERVYWINTRTRIPISLPMYPVTWH